MMDTPQFLHCFSAFVEPDPNSTEDAGVKVDYQIGNRFMTAGETRSVQFKLTYARDGAPITGLTDISVMYYQADGRGRQVIAATEVGDGEYAVELSFPEAATYYIFVATPTHNLDYTDLAFYSLIAIPGE